MRFVLTHKLERVKSRYPKAQYLGIADGAKDNWSDRERHTNRQLLDFFHVTEYLAKVAWAAYPQKTGQPERQQWLHDRCHQLKHEPDAARDILTEMRAFKRKRKLSESVRGDVLSAIRYFENHLPLMKYCLALLTRIGAVGEKVARSREAIRDRLDRIDRPVAILNAGAMKDHEQHQADAIDKDMPLAALDRLAGVIARNPTAFGGLHALAVDPAPKARKRRHAGGRRRFPTFQFAGAATKTWFIVRHGPALRQSWK